MLISLLYVSHCEIPADVETAVRQIVELAEISNRERDLTGALLFTGTYFAQVIEGRDEAVDGLFTRLEEDTRHNRLTVAQRSPLAERRFQGWGMAYFGPSLFVSRHVTRLLNDASTNNRERATDWLIELMHEFRRP